MSVFAQMFRQRTREARTARIRLEALEARETPATLSGTAWPKPERVTISFTPDGTNLGGPTSNLFSAFNTKFGTATTWQNQILKAAQQWAQHTNLNFAVVSDNGTAIGSGAHVQGHPNFGDIRIGGYNFGTTTLAQAYLPPPVINFSTAGDIQFNTGQTWNIGSTYDLHTAAMHEFGHALGLYHGAAGSAMDGVYNSALATVQPDDISGIQSVVGYALTNGITSPGYGGTRDHDAFDAAASNNTSGTAKDLTSLINTGNKTLVVGGLDITSTSDVDWYRFTAPAGSATTMTVKVQSSGLSLLAPKFQLYNSSLGTLGTLAIGSGFQGSTLSRTVSIAAGQTYYLMVDGNTNDAMGTGAYGLSVQFASTVPGAIGPPNTTTAEGSPRVNGGGQAVSLGPETLVNSTVTNVQQTAQETRQAIAMDHAGNYVVVYSSMDQDGNGWGVFARMFNSSGVALAPAFRVNTYTNGHQSAAAVAMNDNGEFVVAWESSGQDGGGIGIYARRYHPDGQPASAEFRVSTVLNNDQTHPVLAIDSSGRFVIAWQESGRDGNGWGIFSRHYEADGSPAGSETQVNTITLNDQVRPAVGLSDNGNYTITWSSDGQDGSGLGVYAQVYNWLGQPLQAAFRVNTHTADYQDYSSVAMNPNGTAVISWASKNQDGSGWGVYARVYNDSGVPQSNEFRVNTSTQEDQMYSSVTVNSNSNFLITWSSQKQDGDGWGIYGQQFTPTGATQGSEFRVSSTTALDQVSSGAAMNSNGVAVVVWSGNGLGDSAGVLAQRYMVSYSGMNPLEPHRFDPEGHDHDHDHEHGAECAEDIHLTLDDDHDHESDGGLSSHDIESAQEARASVEDFDAVALGTLDEIEPVHVYRFQVPRGGRRKFLTVGTLALSNDQDAPSLALFDAVGRPVPMNLVLAEPRTFAAQVRPDWVEGMTFYLKAFGPRGRAGQVCGDYCLGVDFSRDSLV